MGHCSARVVTCEREFSYWVPRPARRAAAVGRLKFCPLGQSMRTLANWRTSVCDSVVHLDPNPLKQRNL